MWQCFLIPATVTNAIVPLDMIAYPRYLDTLNSRYIEHNFVQTEYERKTWNLFGLWTHKRRPCLLNLKKKYREISISHCTWFGQKYMICHRIWIDISPSMDKLLHPLHSVGSMELLIDTQTCNHWNLGTDKDYFLHFCLQKQKCCPHFDQQYTRMILTHQTICGLVNT